MRRSIHVSLGYTQLSFEILPGLSVLLEHCPCSFKYIRLMKICEETVMKILMFFPLFWPSQIKEHLAKGQRMLAGDGMSEVTKTLLDLTQRKNFYAGDLLMSVEILRNVTDTFKRASYIPASDGVQVREVIPCRKSKWAWDQLWSWEASAATMGASWPGGEGAHSCWGKHPGHAQLSSGNDLRSLVILYTSVSSTVKRT